MKKFLMAASAGAALCSAVGSAQANVLLYSFESGDTPSALDGFARNGGGIAVASTTSGATNGTGALQLTATGGFVGALSTTQGPLTTLDNPSVTAITIDVFNPSTFGGTFADLGVTLFVGNGTTGDFGEQFGPPTSSYANVDLPAGTETTVTIPLIGSSPVTGNTETYSQLLAEGYVPTGFEFSISSNAAAATPLVIDVDNVQAVGIGAVPEPASLGLLGLAGGFFMKRRSR